MLEARGIGYRVGQHWLVRDLNLSARPGEFWAVIGPNGAGKSTLLRLLSGEMAPAAGRVTLDGRDLREWSGETLARQRALLSQSNHLETPFPSIDVVLMGRFPHSPGQRTSALDVRIADASLQRVQAAHLRERSILTLSGGEKGRVDLARILAQQPRIFLLDEPTHHLDARHQIETLDLCRELALQGHTIIAVLHDFNLAALYAQRILLLDQGACVAAGSPADVLTRERIARVFGINCQIWTHPQGCPWVVPCPAQYTGGAP